MKDVDLQNVEAAAWLTDRVLLLTAQMNDLAAPAPKLSIRTPDQRIPLEVRGISFTRRAEHGANQHAAMAILAHVPMGWDRADILVVHGSNGTGGEVAVDLSLRRTDLKFMLRSLCGLDADARTRIMDFLASQAAFPASPEADPQLSRSLAAVRQALRERLPASVMAREYPLGLQIDVLLGVDEKSFYVRGRLQDQEGQAVRLTAVSPEGIRVELFDKLSRHCRRDMESLYGAAGRDGKVGGISCFFQTATPSRLAEGWVFEMTGPDHRGIETPGPTLVREVPAVREALLQDLACDRTIGQDLVANHIFPALLGLQERHRRSVKVHNINHFGKPPAAPEVSIIVPLFGRIDLVEHQLAQFAHDRHMSDVDLIYVLDSPELADKLREMAPRLSVLYQMPFRVVMMEGNSGYAAVNNAGADLARGKFLVLLNSDAFPDQPGWVEALANFYTATPQIGALGCKLLFEDDSLQHAGLYFAPLLGTNDYEKLHYFKGMHRNLPAANVARPVPAVTGACLMIDSGLYRELGGMRGIFVQGDYEDSDLCLRLLKAGYENWYLPTVELYHLEGQSYPAAQRQLTSRYNRWLHTHLWEKDMASVMARYGT